MGPTPNNLTTMILDHVGNKSEQPLTKMEDQSDVTSSDLIHVPYHNTPLYNYFLVSLITLLVVVAVLVLYSYFFMWVLKGNLDLPNPGGGYPKRPSPMTYFINPLPAMKRAFNRGYPTNEKPVENSTIQTTDVSVESAQESRRRRSLSLQNLPSEDADTSVHFSRSNSAENSSTANRLSTIFESKSVDVCKGLKQFKQFGYGRQADEGDDVEEVVFDAYNLQH